MTRNNKKYHILLNIKCKRNVKEKSRTNSLNQFSVLRHATSKKLLTAGNNPIIAGNYIKCL